MTTKKEEIYRIPVDGKGDWEKIPGWPIPLSIKIRYPDGGAERTLEFENKDELDNTTCAALLKEIARVFEGVDNIGDPSKITLKFSGLLITADVAGLLAIADEKRVSAVKAGNADDAKKLEEAIKTASASNVADDDEEGFRCETKDLYAAAVKGLEAALGVDYMTYNMKKHKLVDKSTVMMEVEMPPGVQPKAVAPEDPAGAKGRAGGGGAKTEPKMEAKKEAKKAAKKAAKKVVKKKVKKDKPGTRKVPRAATTRYGPRYGVKVMNFQAVKAGPRDLPNSLWVTGPEVIIDINPDEIEGLFKKPVKKKKGPPKPKKPEPVSLIDPKRSNNCGIAMSRVKLPFEQLMGALVACDPMQLAEDEEAVCDMCELLMQIAPEPDEMKEINGWLENPKNDPEMLADVEKFFLKISAVEGDLVNRLTCMNLMMTLESRIFSAKGHILDKIAACRVILEGLGVPKEDWVEKPEVPPPCPVCGKCHEPACIPPCAVCGKEHEPACDPPEPPPAAAG